MAITARPQWRDLLAGANTARSLVLAGVAASAILARPAP